MKQVLLALLLVMLSAPAAADPFHYFIQVGAFRTEQDALNQVAKLKEANNIPAVVSAREQGGRTVYRVRIGPFRDKSVSDSVKSQLEAIGLETALVRVEGQPNNATFLDNTIGRSSPGAQPAPPPSTRTQPPFSERQAQTEQAPRKLEREICDAMALKCGQDINNSDCRAFQASVRNNGYRCAVSPSQAAEKSPSSSAWGACVVPTVQSQGTRNPSLTLNNNCPGLISWRYCVRVSGRNFADTPSGITQAGSSSSYRLMLEGQETYDWRHTWCAGRCDPAIPRC